MKTLPPVTANFLNFRKTPSEPKTPNLSGQGSPKIENGTEVSRLTDSIMDATLAADASTSQRGFKNHGIAHPRAKISAKPASIGLADLRSESAVKCSVVLRRLGVDSLFSKQPIERLANESFTREMPYFLAQRVEFENGSQVNEPIYADAAELLQGMTNSLAPNKSPGRKAIEWQDGQKNFVIFCLPSPSEPPIAMGSLKSLSENKIGDFFLSRVLTIGKKKNPQDRIMSLLVLYSYVELGLLPAIPLSSVSSFLQRQLPSKIMEEQVNILTLACLKDDDILIDAMIKRGTPVHSRSASEGVYPISYAAANGCMKNIEKLLALGAKFGEDQDYLHFERTIEDYNRETMNLARLPL